MTRDGLADDHPPDHGWDWEPPIHDVGDDDPASVGPLHRRIDHLERELDVKETELQCVIDHYEAVIDDMERSDTVERSAPTHTPTTALLGSLADAIR